LPTDDLSIENGIIVTKATRYPLLIDPQLQGKTWILHKEEDFNLQVWRITARCTYFGYVLIHFSLQVTWFAHKYFRNHLEDSIALGRPLLIMDVEEELDPVLDNLMEKNFIKIGKTLKVKRHLQSCVPRLSSF